MARSKHYHKMVVIQLSILMAFLFGLIVAFVAVSTGDFLMGLIFLGTLHLIVLLAILFLLEKIFEITEAKL